jgi:ATP-dependent metalloprotease FtsH
MENTVIRTVLQLCDRYISNPSKTHPYHVLFGYAKLLSMDEATVHMLFTDEESVNDLEEGRRYFEEYALDAQLMKMGLPYLFGNIQKQGIEDKGCRALLDQVLDKKLSLSSYELLDRILPKSDGLFDVFSEGHTMEDVFQYQKQCSGSEPSAVKTRTEKAPERPTPKKPEGKAESKEEKNKEQKSFRELSEVYRKLRVDLLDVVKGQNDPVLEFVQGCFHGDVLTDTDSKRKIPKATFLFVGPPGVGKTLLAQTAAESLGYPSMMFNMSEYSAEQSHEGIIGIAPFYKSAEEGRLVKFVRENPKCILIFDEIEKAHRNVIQLFLQILDLGTLDNVFRKEKTEFKDAIIIFTSNACSSIYDNNYGNISKTPKHVLMDALRHEVNPTTGRAVFPEAICSRIAAGNLIMFNHLSIRDMTQMVSSHFDKTAAQIKEDYGYQVSYDSKLPLLFVFHHGAAMDARIATRQSDKFIKNELFELSRQLESHQNLLDGVETLHFEVDLNDPEMDEDLKGLFLNPQVTEIAVVCKPEDRHCFRMPDGYRVHFADSVQELQECMKNEISLALIDLTVGLTEEGIRGVSMDDYHSIGVNAFKWLEEDGDQVPIYLFESGSHLEETDKNTFFQKGAAGVVSAVDASDASVCRRIQQISEELFMEKQGKEFGRRGYVLNFNTAQITGGNTLRIQYHELKKQQALDSESASSFISDLERPNVRFEDVIGAANAKEELQYFIKYLSNPGKFIREGGKPAKGVLLYGPPGTGKTMLARAMAGESDVAFIQTSATEFMTKWFGQSEQNVRDLFKRARQYAPAIIFIDEIDAIGKTRNGENSHTESVLNTLLTEMDGFQIDQKHPVFVLAATNYSIDKDDTGRGSLDPALVRRFDNRIYVDLPNEKERLQYLQLIVKKKGFPEISESILRNLAQRTPGVSIAVLQNVVDLAFRNARKEDRLPDGQDMQNALEEYNYGEKREWNEAYYRSVAIHESGHAYLAYLSGEKPSYMTIESRGNFGGYMSHENGENKPNYTRQDLLWRIRCSLGGRAAEEVFYGKEEALNTGASSDLQNATQYAIKMICDYGMMEGQLLALPFSTISGTPLAANYLEQANQLLQREMQTTIQLIAEGKERVQGLAEQLLANNHLTGDEIMEVLSGRE